MGVMMGASVFYVKGTFVREDEAVISVMDHGFLYGDGVFEAIRVYNGKIFKFDEHMDRLYESAKIINLEIPLYKDEFKRIVIETIRKNNYRDCYIRPQVTRGSGLLGADPTTCKRSTIIVYVTPPPTLKKEKSIRAIVSSYRRPPSFVSPPESKMTQYINNILAKIEAKGRGADDAILLDIRGFVSEGSGWNIFLVKNRDVVTPSCTSSILMGITRNVVMQILKELNYQIAQRDVTLSELFTADEVFGTGSGTEITPIIEINGRMVGEGNPGPLTNEIEIKFKDFVQGSGTPVYE